MSETLFAFFDIALVFGAVLGLAFWQLWILRRDRRREVAARTDGAPSGEGRGPPSAG